MFKTLKSKKLVKTLLFLVSLLIGSWLYVSFFMNLLPRFFGNMENIEKNILAVLIIVLTTYVLLLILLRIDSKKERYVLLGLYLLVLILGLLRLDPQHRYATGEIGLNPLGFISDISGDEASFYVMVINLVIFVPFYFLLAYANLFKGFWSRLLIFELFILLIEYLQFQFNFGLFDLSDIFLYNIGFLVGYVISLPILKLLK
ncbi:VanZ family protein [Planococcus sp. S3-L1]|uniref:VanZ family protein n=1 Tax=Planococcus sp. S3-L1 TaxID=3046200 RepID=UPI0024B8CC02|nr:VanZ family protein [Planococcus sp. S3-L1]MDJ0332682.1 VanZ family protein [Planococcus sp. S3-L1]